MNAEAFYMAKIAHEAYNAVLRHPWAFIELTDLEKEAWEAAADAIRDLVMRTLMPRGD